MAHKSTIILVFILAICTGLHAQFADSIKISIGTTATYAGNDYQPLWITSNKYGTIADRKSDLSTNLQFKNIHRFKSKQDTALANPFYVQYGFDLFNNQHFNTFFLKEAFLKTGFKKLEFRAGRFDETTGEMDANTSSGSIGISGNALPIPKIGFALTDYIPVPFTNGFAKFKGQISHGWFGNNRYMKNAFYHEKTFYLQLGKKKLKIYGGLQHFVEWGGKRGNVQLDRSIKGFFDVLLVRQADDGSVGTSTNNILPNRPGDQRGLFEAGFKWENDKMIINGYQQTPFETGRDVDIRNVDRLIGLHYAAKKTDNFIQHATFELLNTKDMLSFVEISDRQSFYNNGYYKTGWEYNDRIVGTPLFINRMRASKYYSNYTPYNWNSPDNSIVGNDNIVNNRVTCLHLGLFYKIASALTAKTMITYTKNYGTHNTASPFYPFKTQLYSLQQFDYTFHKHGITLTTAIGFDRGQMTDNTGFLLGIKKTFAPGLKRTSN